MDREKWYPLIPKSKRRNIVASIKTGMPGASRSAEDLANQVLCRLRYQTTSVPTGLSFAPLNHADSLSTLLRAASLHEPFRPACDLLKKAIESLYGHPLGGRKVVYAR